MNKMMKILALVLALAMMTCFLAACGKDNQTDDNKANDKGSVTEPNTTEPQGTEPQPSDPQVTDPTTPPEDGKKEYKVYVKDAAGNPLAGVLVQSCKEGSTCFTPARTNDEGYAVWSLEEAVDYYGTFSSIVEGMPKVYFGTDFEVTIVVKAYKIKVVDANGDPVVGLQVQVGKVGCDTFFTPTKTNDQGEAVWMLPILDDFYGTVSSLEEGMPKQNFEDGFEIVLIYNPPVAE